MGEHKNNPLSKAKADLDLSKFRSMTVDDVDNIAAITELARLGLNALKQILPGMKEESEKENGAYSKEQYENYKILAEEAGPKAYAHFQAMAKFLAEQFANGMKHANPDAAPAPEKPAAE